MEAAPSEEFILHCDVLGCPGQLSMVGGVARSEHGWGRLTRYTVQGTENYDLCSEHNKDIADILKSPFS